MTARSPSRARFALGLRRESHTFAFSAVPLVVGLLLLGPVAVAVLRVGATLAILGGVRRQPPFKLVANLATHLTEVAVAAAIMTVLPEGVAPELARVQHTDGAEIGVFADRHTDRAMVICAIDNLGKGAAGQAVQNVNALFGLAETAGLRLSGVLV